MGGGDAQNGESLAAIMVRKGAHKEGDMLSMIFPDFEENHGKSMCLQNVPFLLANHG